MYATVDDLDIFFGSDEMGVFDTAGKEAILSSVSGYMDSFLGSYYSTPLDLTDKPANTVNLIKHICCGLARCQLHDDVNSNGFETLQRSCDSANNMLDKIKSGEIRLQGLTIKPVILHHQNTRLFSIVSES